jgi:hypothetical protein
MSSTQPSERDLRAARRDAVRSAQEAAAQAAEQPTPHHPPGDDSTPSLAAQATAAGRLAAMSRELVDDEMEDMELPPMPRFVPTQVARWEGPRQRTVAAPIGALAPPSPLPPGSSASAVEAERLRQEMTALQAQFTRREQAF